MADAKNQTPKEQDALVATGRRGLELAVEKMAHEIIAVAAPNIKASSSTWMQRAVIAISKDDKLRPVLQSRAGILSIIHGFEKAATMGLQIGGQFPHCYFVGYGEKAEMIISAEGYKHAATHGPGAVLTDFTVRRVYEGENFSVDFAGAKVSHSYDGKERGKLIGVYGLITLTTGRQLVKYMTRTEALLIRDSHSTAYKKGLGPWKSDEDAMIEKTAAKSFLKEFAAGSEGLSMLFSQDGDDQEYQAPPRDVSERMAGHLDAKVIKTAAPAKSDTETVQGQSEIVADDIPETGSELF